MVYKVIGLMSGSSLDGLDIVYTHLEEVRGQWKFDIQDADCIPYDADWAQQLAKASQLSVPDFLKLHTAYGRYIGEQVNQFISRKGIQHQVQFIASHGHTAYHDTPNQTTCQIGDGASIAAITSLPVISDLRNLDVALGGQGAPIVPIGDRLLLGKFDYWLNIGGIANITVRKGDSLLAYDLCGANQIMNILAAREGKPMDEEGELAKQGHVLQGILEQITNQDYYQQAPPKSLSNDVAQSLIFPYLMQSEHTTHDMLRTALQHIIDQVAQAVKDFPAAGENPQMLVTGGGALNNFLTEQLRAALQPLGVNPVVPYEEVVQYKEALIMALIGVLRWREETNTLASVTGAQRDSIGGALWMGHSFNGE